VEKGIFFKRRISLSRKDVMYHAVTKTPLEYLFGVCSVTLVAKGCRVNLYFLPSEELEKLW
jgi:hypothetical protein